MKLLLLEDDDEMRIARERPVARCGSRRRHVQDGAGRDLHGDEHRLWRINPRPDWYRTLTALVC